MTKGNFYRFLAACAAGGAIAPTVALTAARAAGFRRSSESISDERMIALCFEANAIACMVARDEDPAPYQFDCDGTTPIYVTCRGTVIIPTDCGPNITVDGHEVPPSHYRQRAADYA